MIVALAGRRIDAPDTSVPRFPLEHAASVRERLFKLFTDRKATALVCSAACGADLLALDVAGELGMRRRIILPFAQSRFREVSVVDRPGDWGTLFDGITHQVAATGDLVTLNDENEDGAIFATTNRVILDQALALAAPASRGTTNAVTGKQAQSPVVAVIVWDGQSRGPGDLTLDFADEARLRGLPVIEVAT